MKGRREIFSLLLAFAALSACGGKQPGAPELPASVSPGWKLASFAPAPKPDEVVGEQPAACWKGQYTGPGMVDVWVCAYRQSASAFDAAQRSRAEAQTVKFQTGDDLVLVKWNNTPRASLEALIRQLMKTLH